MVKLVIAQEWDFKPSLINNGLLQNSITGIQKDNRGFIWISTQFGIYRYDGKNINKYTSGTSSKIKSNRFSYIIEDARQPNNLIAVDEKMEYIIKDGFIVPLLKPTHKVAITNIGFLHYIDQSKLGNWKKNSERLGSANMYLFENDTIIKYTNEYYNITKQLQYHNKGLDSVTQGFEINYQKKVWIIKKEGLFIATLNDKQWYLKKVYSLLGNKSFIQIKKQYCWFQNEDQLIKFDLLKNEIVYQISLSKYGIKNASSCYEDNDKMYIGTPSQGIFESFISKYQRIKMQDIKSEDNYIYSYAIDKYGNYYSANTFGLFKKRSDRKDAENIFKHRLYSTVLNAYKNNIWIASLANQIIAYNIHSEKKSFVCYLKDDIKRIEQVNDSIVYFTSSKNIYQYNINSKLIHSIFHVQNDESIFTAISSNNNWYIGTDKGLVIYNNTTNERKHYLTNEYVRSILVYDNSSIILGTYSNGTYLMQNGQAFPFNNDPSMVSKAVVALSKDKDENLWILCNKGAYIWERRKIEKLKTEHKDLQYSKFLETNGIIPSSELNGGQIPSSFPTNKIILPTSNGLVFFTPKDIIGQYQNPRISLRDILVDGMEINLENQISIPAAHNEIVINIDFPYFETDNNFNVQYRVKGLYNEWKNLNSNRKIVFNRLQDGQYTIELRFNQDANPEFVCTIEVIPFWYHTLWFYIGIAVIFVVLLLLLIKARTQYLRIKQIELEKIIHQKTKQLQVNLKNLSQSEKEITKLYKHSNKLYSILMHDLKSPLQFLSNYSISEFKNIKNNKKIDKEAIKTIASTSAELFKFINEFLFWLQKQNKKQEALIQPIELSAEIKEVVDLYESICSLNNNKLVFFPKPDPIFIHSDPDMLKIIFRNLLDNANKYTENGVIKISFDFMEQPKQVAIIIQDTGKGLPEHVITLLKEEMNKENFSPSINANHKMGIQITKEFIQVLHGTLELINSDQQGTIFKINLPL